MTATTTTAHGVTIVNPYPTGPAVQASCLCGWASDVVDSRPHAIQAGVRHVEQQLAGGRTTGPITCAPWCVYSDSGHADALFVEDQWCGSEEVRVPLSMQQYGHADQDVDGSPSNLSAYTYRCADGSEHVEMQYNGCDTWQLTADEARALAAALTVAADRITPATVTA